MIITRILKGVSIAAFSLSLRIKYIQLPFPLKHEFNLINLILSLKVA